MLWGEDSDGTIELNNSVLPGKFLKILWINII